MARKQQYHVRADGSMGECNVSSGVCPFKREYGTQHFDSRETAEKYRDKVLTEKYGSVATKRTTPEVPEETPQEKAAAAAIQEWREKMSKDGWTFEPGPYGQSATENSFYAVKDDITVLFRDSYMRPTSHRPGGWNRQISGAWFNNGYTAFNMPEEYDLSKIEAERNRCNFCGQISDKPLRHIGFAGKVCENCDTKELRDRIEFPGWAN